MAAIPGFSTEQNEALKDVQVGDILIISTRMSVYEDSDSDDDSASEGGSEEPSQNGGGAANENDGEGNREICGKEDSESSSEDGSESEEENDAVTSERGDQDTFYDTEEPSEAGCQATLDDQDADDAAQDDTDPDDAAEDDQDAEDATEDNYNPPFIRGTLFAVCKLTTNKSDEITNLSLVKLTYDSLPATSGMLATYQLYGEQCEHSIQADTLAAIASSNKVIQVPTQSITDFEKLEQLAIIAKPSGDLVRDRVHGHRCPAGCQDGFLNTIHDLHGMVNNFTINTTIAHRPVCPSCIGTTLMREHQTLRETLEAFTQVDFGQLVEYYGRLNMRLGPLGYEFKQFDEREWGYHFEDMASDDEGGENGDDFETWDEAMEPNNHIVYHPASKGVIDALPRRVFSELKHEAGDKCTICQETFTEYQIVIVLPCRHVFCEGGCIEQWLGQFDNAPPTTGNDMADPVAVLLTRDINEGRQIFTADDLDLAMSRDVATIQAFLTRNRDQDTNQDADQGNSVYEDDDSASDGLATDEEDAAGDEQDAAGSEDVEEMDERTRAQLELFRAHRDKTIEADVDEENAGEEATATDGGDVVMADSAW